METAGRTSVPFISSKPLSTKRTPKLDEPSFDPPKSKQQRSGSRLGRNMALRYLFLARPPVT